MKTLSLVASISLGAILSLCSQAALAVPISDQFAIYYPDGSLEQSVTIYEDGSAFAVFPGAYVGNPGNFFGDPATYYVGPYPFAPFSGEGLACPGQCYGAGFGLANGELAGGPILWLYDGASVSDYLGVYINSDPNNPFAGFYFASDPEADFQFGPGTNQGCVAIGNACDVTGLLAPGLIEAGWTATFFSDGDVPEPMTLSLFGAGLVGAAAIRRRKKKEA